LKSHARNDTYGHLVGDLVLRSLSRFLKQRLRKVDSVGRLGGEEFGVILLKTNEPIAQTVLNRLREDFAKVQHVSQQGAFSVTFSCGVARAAAGSLGVAVMKEADRALYAAKRSGRNRVICAGASDASCESA
jgi:diguanylate cyclase (GGDEF)-like protein